MCEVVEHYECTACSYITVPKNRLNSHQKWSSKQLWRVSSGFDMSVLFDQLILVCAFFFPLEMCYHQNISNRIENKRVINLWERTISITHALYWCIWSVYVEISAHNRWNGHFLCIFVKCWGTFMRSLCVWIKENT